MNLFAATGHIELMRELPTDHPWLYRCFTEQGFHAVRRSNRFWAGLWTDLIIEQVMMRSIKSRGGLTRGRGVTEAIRLQWIYSMHKCAAACAMTTVTDLQHMTSEQHVELGTSRSTRDYEDLIKIQNWFDQHEPFNLNELNLHSLSSGLSTAFWDDINCDETETVGMKIHKQLDKVSVIDASIKKKEQVHCLDHLLPGIQVDKKKDSYQPYSTFF